MSPRFTVLASGSSGNAALLDLAGQALLIDFGLSPRRFSRALEWVGKSISRITHALLTHLHGDHFREDALAFLAEGSALFWCHAEHAQQLAPRSAAFAALEAEGRVRLYELGVPFECGDCRAVAFELAHDVFTCGFRIEGCGSPVADAPGSPWAIGFASDLGSWTEALVAQLIDVDLLALEFNHDVMMQVTSRRHPWLIRRNLGAGGHLSNEQAARLLEAIVERSAPGRLKHVVPLHLSRQCNRPELAVAAAAEALEARGADVSVVPARAHHPLAWIDPGSPGIAQAATIRKPRKAFAVDAGQPLFPGWD
jgi:phosphoribosyl 1,2-cyclic phosphodiesterase